MPDFFEHNSQVYRKHIDASQYSLAIDRALDLLDAIGWLVGSGLDCCRHPERDQAASSSERGAPRMASSITSVARLRPPYSSILAVPRMST